MASSLAWDSCDLDGSVSCLAGLDLMLCVTVL